MDAAPATPVTLWRHRDFLYFWSGQTISVFGDQITLLALPLAAILALDAGAAEMGMLTAAAWGPHLVLSLFAGVWIDRRSRRRRIMIGADLARALVLLSVPLAWWLDALTIEQLYGVAFLVGCGAVFFDQSYSSAIVTIVPRSLVVDANAKLSTSRAGAYVAGPSASGALVEALTAPVALLADAASYVASALFLSRVRSAEPAVERRQGEGMWRGIAQGVRWILSHPLYRPSLLCTSTINFFNLMFSAILVLYLSEELELAPAAIGLVFGAGGIGALAGAVAAPRISRRIGLGPAIALGAVVFPGATLLYPLADGPRPLVIALLVLASFLAGVGVMIFDVNNNSVGMLIVPYRLRGRTAGAGRFFNYGVRPLGSLAGGALGSTIGLRPTLVVGAVGTMLAVLWVVFSPLVALRDEPELPEGDV
jgi:MFS family permease